MGKVDEQEVDFVARNENETELLGGGKCTRGNNFNKEIVLSAENSGTLSETSFNLR